MSLDSGSLGVGVDAESASARIHVEETNNRHAAFIHNTNSSFSSNTLQVSTSRNTTNSSYNHFTCSIHGIANERAIAAQGILSFGGASMIGTFSKVSVASGVLVGIIEASANFSQDTDAIFIASADVVKSFNFTQDTAANRVKPAVASAISDFTQSTTGTFIGTGISTLDANFTQSSAGITIASGISEQSFNFTQVSTATLIAHGLIEASAQFDQTTVGIAIRTGSATMDFAFDQTTVATLVATGAAEIIAIFVSTANGEILWERIDPGGSPNWLDITHTGDTWTEITVGGTTETWTETVV
jgi:hypothetical protein